MSDEKTNKKPPQRFSETGSGLIFPGEEDFELQGIPEDSAEDGLETDDHQAAEIREIFGTAFPQYLQPVEEIVEQILSGTGDPESAEALAGMITSLMEASSRMGFENINLLLGRLQKRISSIESDFGSPVTGDIREDILGDIMDLKDIAEEMGGETQEAPKERRRTIVSALKDKEGVGKVVLKRLSAAGLVTVDQLLMARPDEIAAVAGIDIDIVNTILGHLSEGDPSGDDSPLPAATQKQPDEMASDVESLHEQILEKLHAEAEIEVSIEALRAEIRGLRSRIFEYRAEIKSLDISLGERMKAWDHFSEQMADKTGILDDLRARREAQERKYRSSEEEIQKKELKLQTIRQQRRSIDTKAVNLSQALGGLVRRIQKVQRSINKRQLV